MVKDILDNVEKINTRHWEMDAEIVIRLLACFLHLGLYELAISILFLNSEDIELTLKIFVTRGIQPPQPSTLWSNFLLINTDRPGRTSPSFGFQLDIPNIINTIFDSINHLPLCNILKYRYDRRSIQ